MNRFSAHFIMIDTEPHATRLPSDPAPLIWVVGVWSIMLTGGACGESGPTDGVHVQFTNGVRIVENRTNHPPQRWIASGEPLLEVGGASPPQGHDIHRVTGVERLEHDRWAIADDSRKEIRIFDTSGRLLRTIGGEGGGPGEFRQIAGLYFVGGDSLAAWDPREQRLTVFDSSGKVARSVDPVPPPSGRFPPLHGILRDRSLILGSGLDVTGVFLGGTGTRRPERALFRYSRKGERLNMVGRFPGTEQFAWVRADGFSLRRLPFGRGTHFAVGAGRIFVATNNGDEIRGFGPQGNLRLVIRIPNSRSPVTQEDIQAVRQRRLSDIEPEERAEELRRLNTVEFPDEKAPFTDLVAGADDRIWVRGRQVSPSSTDVEWMVFGANGVLRAIVTIPASLELLAAGENWIAGIQSDDLDIETVRAFHLSPVTAPADEPAGGRRRSR